jgi:NADH dehydrogenase FAD-containing subunit
MAGELKYLDVDKKEISLVGESKKIAFDKLLIAWGSEKKKLK